MRYVSQVCVTPNESLVTLVSLRLVSLRVYPAFFINNFGTTFVVQKFVIIISIFQNYHVRTQNFQKEKIFIYSSKCSENGYNIFLQLFIKSPFTNFHKIYCKTFKIFLNFL